MPAERSWQISAPQTLDFDEPVDELHVRVVGGAVNVVGTSDPGARVEVSEVEGPPLKVTREGRSLVVAYEDLPWQGFLKWLDQKGRRRRAVVSVSVPAAARLSVGVVDASAVVSGVTGPAEVRGVSGDATLVGLTDRVQADTVSGSIETQGVSGPLRFNSVSGDLTVVDGGGSRIKAGSVSGSMIVDLGRAAPRGAAEQPDIRLDTVSGEVAVRLPGRVSAAVEASTAGGGISTAFDELHVNGAWGAQTMRGTLGAGDGLLRVHTVAGAIALLRHPDGTDDPHGSDSGHDVFAGALSLDKDV